LPRIAYGPWPTSALIINTDEPNTIRGRLQNSVFATLSTLFDSTFRSEGSFFGMEGSRFRGPGDNYVIRSFVGGWNQEINAAIDASVVDGMASTINKPISNALISGYGHATADTVNCGFTGGNSNQFGGFGQVTLGVNLINRSRFGAALGIANVDFSSLPWTGFGTRPVAEQSYPLLAVGNGVTADGYFSPGRSNAFTVMFNGRTQINTTGGVTALTQDAVTPKAALDVVSTNTGVLLPRLTNAQRGGIAAGDLQNGLLLYNTDSSVFQYYNGSAWNSVGSGAAGGTSKWMFSSGTTSTVFDTTDNIGIGTSDTKGYRLAVNGSLIATSMKVKPSGNWPDYVFKKSYRLLSLQELETYIRVNKHLPGISPAKEIETDGLNVGEHQVAILKKVEELTLYLIDENKQLKAQNKQILEQNAILQQQQREIDELKALIKNKEK
jgi:hypothetical protein